MAEGRPCAFPCKIERERKKEDKIKVSLKWIFLPFFTTLLKG